MECPAPQRRSIRNIATFRRCLLRQANQLRQTNNQAPMRSITGFKKLFNTVDTDATYNLLENLNTVRKFPYTDFTNLNNLKNLIRDNYLGKNIFVSYLDDNRNSIKDKFYRIPNNISDFITKWDGWIWDWKISDVNIFTATEEGNVYIYESEIIEPRIIQQAYLDNETNNCVFKPIRNVCESKMKESEASSKNYQTILNKIAKLEKIYEKGVPDDKLEEVFTKLKIKMTLSYPFESNKKMVYNGDDKKIMLSMNYINTRKNHLDFYHNDEKAVTLLKYDDFLEKHKELYYAEIPFIYKKNNDGYITEIKTPTETFKIGKEGNPSYVFKDFEEETGLNNYFLCDIKDELLSKFIREGCKITSSVINSKYTDLKQYKKSFKEIDQVKSYTQFKNCSFYNGFVGKITDFRKTDKIQGNGFYLITNLDWTNANKKIKQIQIAFKIWYGRNVYSSVELNFLKLQGVVFKIKGGCWGNRIDFDFNDDMLIKQEGLPNYSRWTGAKTMINLYDDYYMKTNDRDYVAHIKSKCENVDYFDGVMRFSIKKDYNKHLSHVSGFIYAYQRINLVEQLLEMDIDKILRINTDGIKYLEHEFKINKTFKIEEEPSVQGLLNDPREEGFITNTNRSCMSDLLNYQIHFNNTIARQHYNNELFIGAGGCGKTHYNLMDKGLVRPCYVANSYKLITAKENDYKCNVEVLAIVEGKGYDKVKDFKKKYNTIIFDEASMITEETRIKLFEMYKGFKLIFCGDIGFQAEPIGGDEINMKSFQHISEFKNNHRTNDLDLLNNLNGMRECITNNTTYDCNHLRQIGISDVITIYDEKDICLTYTKEKRKGYDVLKGEKYLITVSNDKYNRGDIVYVMPKGKIYEKTNAFTTHSVQGETFYNKIFIDIEIIYSNNLRLLYTAISRAKKIDQIYIVNDVKSVKIEKPKVEKPKVEKPNVKEEVEEEDLYALYNQEKEEKKEDPTTNALTYWFSKSIRAGNF